MADEIEVTKKGIIITWELVFRWLIGLLIPLVAGHIWLTYNNFGVVTQSQVAVAEGQKKQDERLDRIERAILDCLAEKERHEKGKGQ